MGTHLFMVVTTAPSGEEEAYGEWYEQHHMPDVLKVPGFVSAQRFRLAPAPGDDAGVTKFMGLYEIEAEDSGPALKELARRAGGGLMPLYAGGKASMVMRLVGEAITEKMIAAVE